MRLQCRLQLQLVHGVDIMRLDKTRRQRRLLAKHLSKLCPRIIMYRHTSFNAVNPPENAMPMECLHRFHTTGYIVCQQTDRSRWRDRSQMTVMYTFVLNGVAQCRWQSAHESAPQIFRNAILRKHAALGHQINRSLISRVTDGLHDGSRHILRRLGGRARTLHNPGQGGTLSFAFRADRPPERPAEVEGTDRAAHILVVDDNATNRMVAETLCSMFGCTTEPAEDGEEAVAAAASGRFDLILMDIRMPRMDGVAATRQIRALPEPVGRTPIIALTANADSEETASYLGAGMNGVVEKPMKPDQLLQVVRETLALGGDGTVAAA